MPYTKKDQREKFTKVIAEVTDLFNTSGDLNHFISSLVWHLFEKDRSYKTANDLIGVLECVKQEFYRRKVSVYEDEKIKENGDLE